MKPTPKLTDRQVDFLHEMPLNKWLTSRQTIGCLVNKAQYNAAGERVVGDAAFAMAKQMCSELRQKGYLDTSKEKRMVNGAQRTMPVYKRRLKWSPSISPGRTTTHYTCKPKSAPRQKPVYTVKVDGDITRAIRIPLQDHSTVQTTNKSTLDLIPLYNQLDSLRTTSRYMTQKVTEVMEEIDGMRDITDGAVNELVAQKLKRIMEEISKTP